MNITLSPDRKHVLNADTQEPVPHAYWENHPEDHEPSKERIELVGSFGLMFTDPHLCSCGTIVYDTDQ